MQHVVEVESQRVVHVLRDAGRVHVDHDRVRLTRPDDDAARGRDASAVVLERPDLGRHLHLGEAVGAQVVDVGVTGDVAEPLGAGVVRSEDAEQERGDLDLVALRVERGDVEPHHFLVARDRLTRGARRAQAELQLVADLDATAAVGTDLERAVRDGCRVAGVLGRGVRVDLLGRVAVDRARLVHVLDRVGLGGVLEVVSGGVAGLLGDRAAGGSDDEGGEQDGTGDHLVSCLGWKDGRGRPVGGKKSPALHITRIGTEERGVFFSLLQGNAKL